MQKPTKTSLPATLGWRLRLCRLHWRLHVNLVRRRLTGTCFQILRWIWQEKMKSSKFALRPYNWATCHLSFVLHVFSGGFQRHRIINLRGRRGFLVHDSGWLAVFTVADQQQQGTRNNVADQQQLLVSNVLFIVCWSATFVVVVAEQEHSYLFLVRNSVAD